VRPIQIAYVNVVVKIAASALEESKIPISEPPLLRRWTRMAMRQVRRGRGFGVWIKDLYIGNARGRRFLVSYIREKISKSRLAEGSLK
jgi:hypothetical protein